MILYNNFWEKLILEQKKGRRESKYSKKKKRNDTSIFYSKMKFRISIKYLLIYLIDTFLNIPKD